jgi:hypothetical protein
MIFAPSARESIMLVLYTIHDSSPRVQTVSIYFLSLRQLHNHITEQLRLRTLVRCRYEQQ